ncbi:MAG: pyruvate, phosphate dikinase, partial [Clostridium paraputrificum]
NDSAVEVVANKTNNPRFAYDSYRRFIQMFSDVVMGIEKRLFEDKLEAMKEARGVKLDTDLNADDLKELVGQFKELYKKEKGEEFPQDPKVQLIESITAVFRSWDNPRAIVYRRLNDIPGDWGTAVNVQQMVFGNKGETSGTGVIFSRNPATGENKIYGEYLMNAQGEDVVAGIRTPQPISQLEEQDPAIYKQLTDIIATLEAHYKDMQDMEITIEEGTLYFLQTRNGKRTAQAALKIAVDLVEDGTLTKEEAILKVEPKQLDTLLHPAFDVEELKKADVVAKGLPASPGAACGKIAFTADESKERAEKGEKVVLVRLETSPEDIEGMIAAEGILTVRGGMTSHAAVVARGMGTCCVAGCGEIKVDEKAKTVTIGDKTYGVDDYISIDGSTGNIYAQAVKTVSPEITGHFATFMGWADEIRKLKVRTNADTPRDTVQAVEFGAEGIGLCRTEHMFFAEDRIMAVREMIVAKNEEQRRKALDKILPMQRQDFTEIYEALEGMPATIRFLDPPLHEFVPHSDEEIAELSKEMGLTFEELKATVEDLHEFNPMMGHRGCRLAVSYPEIAEMQTRAVIEAALDVKANKGYDIVPEIMIPLVGEIKELKYVKDVVVKTAEAVMEERGIKIDYHVGTMIEIPRAALTADEIAKEADFFSFGTNDLTQMTFGFSRDDAAKFLGSYYDKKIYEQDPFAKLDQTGVGQLVKIAAEKGRATRPDIKLGICGEHGGDPSSVEFCHNVGLNYVSCSPFRVPLARLAAAQAQVKNPR